jgi:hypothetical protein
MKVLKFLIVALWCLNISASGQNLRRSGQKIINQSGNEVILKGMGLGGWMLQEPYMMEMSGIASAQWQIKSKIQDLIGPSNTITFYDAWHANHFTKSDVDSLAAWGFNSVRLPMHYNLFTLPIEDEPVPGDQTWLADKERIMPYAMGTQLNLHFGRATPTNKRPLLCGENLQNVMQMNPGWEDMTLSMSQTGVLQLEETRMAVLKIQMLRSGSFLSILPAPSGSSIRII